MLTAKVLGIVLVTWFLVSPIVATIVGRALKAADQVATLELAARTQRRHTTAMRQVHLSLVR